MSRTACCAFLTTPTSSPSREGDTVCASVHPGAGDMGSKLSMPDGDPTARCPGTEDIHTAYKQGDPSRARQLLRQACDESTSQLEKVRSMPSPPTGTGAPGWGEADQCHHSHLFVTIVIEMGIFIVFWKYLVAHVNSGRLSFLVEFSTCRPLRSPLPPPQGTRGR